jgi:competence CoiA-like predicted nuclease
VSITGKRSQAHFGHLSETSMSVRNGDKSRFHVNRKRKLAKRQRVQALVVRTRGDSTTEKSASKS